MPITAKTQLPINLKKIPALFEYIAQNPQLYQMDSHQGFRIIQGSLDKPGSIFQTTEHFGAKNGFFSIKVKLTFKITKVQKPHFFTFQLIKPLKRANITGQFATRQISRHNTQLQLTIHKNKNNTITTRLFTVILFKTFIKNVIKNQIRKEVEMLKELATQINI